MTTNIFFTLFGNITNKISFLKQDYLGLNINFHFLYNFLLGFSTSLFIIMFSYLMGKKIRELILKKENIFNYMLLIDIAIGYLLLGSGLAVLGIFSLLSKIIIFFYSLSFLLIAIYPFKNTHLILNSIKIFIKKLFFDLKVNKFVSVWVILFVILALVNLINPEIREDQYHVDLPKQFLRYETTIIQPKQSPFVSTVPMLSEMTYLLGISLSSQESARYIHFLFYILVLLTLIELSKIKKYEFASFATLLFASAPVVIHETSTMYVDFQWLFYFLISIVIILKVNKIDFRKTLLLGITSGAMLSAKLWTIVFYPLIVLFFIKTVKNNLSKKIFALLSSSLIISFIWYIRSFIITGNPFYPALSILNDGYSIQVQKTFSQYVGINYQLLNQFNFINVFSPLFFVGIILFLFNLKSNLIILSKLKIFFFLVSFIFLHLFIHFPFGRWLIGLYSIAIIIPALGINNFFKKGGYYKYIINLILIVFYGYYLINALLILPYSLGISDKNKYLTRVLSMDNSSYYDFGKNFDKYISKNDLVVTYKTYGFYYANFNFLDSNFIFDKNNKSFDLLKEKGVNKVFIKGEDMASFCKDLKLSGCNKSKYKLVSQYLEFPTYYLYSIK